MATQTCYPGTVGEEALYSAQWLNINNAKTDDGNFATSTMPEEDGTYYLVCNNFGFSIPSGATINSISVKFKGKSSYGGGTFIDSELFYSGGFVNYANYSDIYLTTTNTEYESDGDFLSDPLWGRTWTPSEINDSDFGFKIAFYYADTAYVDYISITVDYTESGGSSAIKSVNGLAKASVKSFNGLAIASVKNINGLA